MDKDKINIDQFFKASLQYFEGNADEGMFDAIKDKIDGKKVPAPKVSVDDFFKDAILSYESPVEDGLFEEIKSKVDATKVSVDSYFKEALLDYNSYALAIPFSEIQNKLDRERVIDEHFKNALQNYEGKALDKEFAVIRERVVQIQEKEARRRYAWLLLLLLIPALFGVNNYYTGKNNPVAQSNETSTQNIGAEKQDGQKIKDLGNQNVSEKKSNTNNNLNSGNSKNQSTSPVFGNNETKPSVTNTTQPSPGNNSPSNKKADETSTVKSDSKPEDNSTVVKPEETAKGENKEVVKAETTSPVTMIPEAKNNAQNTTLRKPKPKYMIQVFGAASQNSRYLHTDENSKQYYAARTASDRVTTKFNFGVDFLKMSDKFRFGLGLHENQFGQSGNYQFTKNIFDSAPHLDPSGKIDYYWHKNYRDTTFNSAYDNTFTAIEIPIYFSYRLATFAKFDFEVGVSASLSYLATANGTLPNATASDIVQLKNMMKSMNRLGSTGTVSMKLNYNLNSQWQVGTELYLKSNMTSLYKKNTGVNELPYAFGMQWGLGFKF